MIKDNVIEIKRDIANYYNSSSDTAAPARLIAVTKNQTVAAMRQAIDAGIADIGENRVQEAAGKFTALDRAVNWHLIGHLQTNKVKQAVKMFSLIHSVDSVKLAEAIDKCAEAAGKIQPVLIQVNIADEATKYGFKESEAITAARRICGLCNVKLSGLMVIAPNYSDEELTRPVFKRARELFMRLKQELPDADWTFLSMGMSNDYKVALAEGGNMIRVGTGIFGERVYD